MSGLFGTSAGGASGGNSNAFLCASEADMLGSNSSDNDICIRTDLGNQCFVLVDAPSNILANWIAIKDPQAAAAQLNFVKKDSSNQPFSGHVESPLLIQKNSTTNTKSAGQIFGAYGLPIATGALVIITPFVVGNGSNDAITLRITGNSYPGTWEVLFSAYVEQSFSLPNAVLNETAFVSGTITPNVRTAVKNGKLAIIIGDITDNHYYESFSIQIVNGNNSQTESYLKTGWSNYYSNAANFGCTNVVLTPTVKTTPSTASAPALATVAPLALANTAAVGTSTKAAREDHVHSIAAATIGNESGSMVLPNGALMQWGTATVNVAANTANGATNITYPVPFANANRPCVFMTKTEFNINGGATSNIGELVALVPLVNPHLGFTAYQFKLGSAQAYSVRFYWMAIGKA